MPLHTFIPKSERNKAISVVSLIVLILAAAFFYEGILLHNGTIDQVILEKEQSIDRTIEDITLYSFTPYEQRVTALLATHTEITKAFLDQDRETLYRLTLPHYESLAHEDKHLHVMHFHLPNGRSFLRMHNFQNFNDDLRNIRPAVQQVHHNKTPLSCYEIGIYGAFYRIIHPVFHNGAYAGALELGIATQTVLESLKNQISDPLTTFYMLNEWQKVTSPHEQARLVFGQHTLNNDDAPLFQQLPPDLDLLRDNQRLTINKNSYLLHTYPIFHDFQGKSIGGFVVMQDISQPLAAKKSFIFRSLISACLLLLISLLVLHLCFGTLIDKLERSRSNLQETIAQLGMEVSERQQTEIQLYQSKQEWERTFDAIGDIITIMNSQFQILKANQATYKMLNAEPGTLSGKFCYEVFSDRSSSCPGCPCIDTINNRQVSSAEIEHQNLGKNFLITTSPVPDENGEFTHIAHIAKDITEKKELETQLRQAQKMEAIGTLAGGIAHDFNNILTAISGYSQLTMMHAANNEKINRYLQHINKATKRATDLVTQILTFSRQTEHSKKPLEISLIVKEALKLLRSSIPATIDMQQTIDSKANIMADPTQIHQIVMNLATNAYHAMLETGGILAVSTQEVTIDQKGMISELDIIPGDYIRLEVSDTGSGMDAVTREKIFEPYFTTKEIGKGTGLGLAVVHGIVTSLNGYINVYSEPDQGTTFHVYLPIVAEEADHDVPVTAEEPVCMGSERIMFIDDEEVIANMASEVLETYGYTTTIFSDSRRAIQYFTKHPDDYDLIITDMSMPHMTGIQLAKEMKTIRPHLPIILCSGYSEIIIKAKAVPTGISKFIQKPLAMDKLAGVIRELLDTDSS